MDRKDCILGRPCNNPYIHRNIEGHLIHSYLLLVELGKPYMLLKGRTIARKLQCIGGKGRWKKRMPTERKFKGINFTVDFYSHKRKYIMINTKYY